MDWLQFQKVNSLLSWHIWRYARLKAVPESYFLIHRQERQRQRQRQREETPSHTERDREREKRLGLHGRLISEQTLSDTLSSTSLYLLKLGNIS